MARLRNPFGFSQGPVTFVLCAVYVAIVASLLYVHHVVPRAPKSASPVSGVNLTEAWRDLQYLSGRYHPFNSKQNDVVRSWLLTRIEAILEGNEAPYVIEQEIESKAHYDAAVVKDKAPVVIFDDLNINVSFPNNEWSVHFEGTNIMVYVRGTEDGKEDWWRNPRLDDEGKPRGVLVNAHYDSVSTGLGATDDGVGVVTILQLIKHYTTTGQRPKRGLVALLNNGEEDGLHGARAFIQHPISRFTDTFLNLEGAGAGGRATLFRATDAEVAKAYRAAPYPFGTVLASDAFENGLIRSQTDYIVFNGIVGMRGLDVAFFEPRSRYHTIEDSSRHTSKDSLWHMLSTALATTKALTSDTETDFDTGEGSRGVWFDVFGRAFGLLTLQSMFGLSVALLVVTPILLIALVLVLNKLDKYYLFARKAHSNPLDPHSPDESSPIEFGGWRGLFRFPIAVVLASAAVVALAFMLAKVNPLILYSSEYSVWSMLLSAWVFVAWFLLRGADFTRPSALTRAHSLGWLFFIMWVVLVACTFLENARHTAGVYPIAIYLATVFLALAISYLEFLALPKKQAYIEQASRTADDNATAARQAHHRSSSFGSGRVLGGEDERPRSSRDHEDATETTSLLGGKRDRSRGQLSTSRRSNVLDDAEEPRSTGLMRKLKRPYGDEQGWSGHLPSSLWLLQFSILAPVNLIILGPIALFLTSALHQTPADGNSVLFIYICIAVSSILLLLPISPFLHRISSRVPIFLLFVFIGTLIYNLTAFPFSEQNRLKVFFRQDLDLDTGVNNVTLTGLDGYVQDIVRSLPSSGGQTLDCSSPELVAKRGLVTCKWHGLAPNVVPRRFGNDSWAARPELAASGRRYQDWMSVKAKRKHNGTDDAVVIEISGRETRACRLHFDAPISDFSVKGASEHDKRVSSNGTKQVRLWSRDWEKPWEVSVQWSNTTEVYTAKNKKKDHHKKNETEPRTGRAACLWSDANIPGMIPAFDEVKLHMPIWSIVSKLDDGLVIGYMNFKV